MICNSCVSGIYFYLYFCRTDTNSHICVIQTTCAWLIRARVPKTYRFPARSNTSMCSACPTRYSQKLICMTDELFPFEPISKHTYSSSELNRGVCEKANPYPNMCLWERKNDLKVCLRRWCQSLEESSALKAVYIGLCPRSQSWTSCVLRQWCPRPGAQHFDYWYSYQNISILSSKYSRWSSKHSRYILGVSIEKYGYLVLFVY